MSDIRPRLKKILNLYGQALLEAVSKCELTCATSRLEVAEREAQLSEQALIQRFSDMDPTPGKSRTQWMVKTYIEDDQFKLEDLGRAHAALSAFERFKPKLQIKQRELSRLKSLHTLEALIDPFVKAEAKARLERDLSSATGREKKRLEEMKARDESIILQEGDGLPTIAVPMTEFASCWWGRGTKWCTAAEKDNAFAQYHKDAPLVIVSCPNGDKFQVYVTKYTFQFMNETDEEVGEKTVQERWSELKSLVYWALQQNGLVFKYLPEEYKTSAVCNIVIQQNGMILQFIPENKMTPALSRMAIEQSGQALKYVPEKYRTPELYRIALKQDGQVLKHVTEKYKTPELYRIAVEQNGLAVKYVPREHRTLEICRIAIKQNGQALFHLSEYERIPELCCLAVEQDGMALYSIPENRRTSKLCHLAVEQNGVALFHVSEDYRTPELCRIAVKQNGEALQAVPEKYQIPELCRIAVEQNGLALGNMLEDERTPELCRLAVAQNGLALKAVPKKYQIPELCRMAVQQHGQTLRFIPKDKRTPELCFLAIQEDIQALQFVPEKHRTPELLAFIPPMQPKWHPDILQGLGCQPLRGSRLNHSDTIEYPLNSGLQSCRI
jgi:hypothetical protein